MADMALRRKPALERLYSTMKSRLEQLELECLRTKPDSLSEERIHQCDRALSRQLRRIRAVQAKRDQKAREHSHTSAAVEDTVARQAHKHANPSMLELNAHTPRLVSSFLPPKEAAKLAIALGKDRSASLGEYRAAETARVEAAAQAASKARAKYIARAHEATQKHWLVPSIADRIRRSSGTDIDFSHPPIYTMRESLATIFERTGHRELLPLVNHLAAVEYAIDVASALTNSQGQHGDLLAATDKMRRKTHMLILVLRSGVAEPPAAVVALAATREGKQLMRHMTYDESGLRPLSALSYYCPEGVPRWWHDLIA